MRNVACAFTGHRPMKFSFGYDEEDERCIRLKLVMAQQIASLIESHVSLFYTGMAQGVDQWGAEIVLDMKRQYPHVRLIAVLPCETQANKWSVEQRERYFNTLPECDEVIMLNAHYTPECMLERNHIIYNSTSLDCQRKFRDFRGSGLAVRKISDRLCLEHGLSIIENPKRGKKHYGKWLGDNRKLSFQEKLRIAIDAALDEKPATFNSFLQSIRWAGYEIKAGKHLAFRIPGQKKFTRLRSLGKGYSEEEICAVIAGGEKHTPRKTKRPNKQPQGVNLLVDIQAKLQAGKGPGYERWAKVFNLKQMAQTMNFLTENNLLEYAELEEKSAAATARFNTLSAQIKTAETRMAEIGNLKTHIVNYSKTRDVYTAYRKAGYSKKFYEENASDILLHKAAKSAFDTLPGKKIPTIKALQAEYETLLSEMKKAYSGYAAARKEMKELLTAKMNIDRLLGDARELREKNREQDR